MDMDFGVLRERLEGGLMVTNSIDLVALLLPQAILLEKTGFTSSIILYC
jgi:hypothetical protein